MFEGERQGSKDVLQIIHLYGNPPMPGKEKGGAQKKMQNLKFVKIRTYLENQSKNVMG